MSDLNGNPGGTPGANAPSLESNPDHWLNQEGFKDMAGRENFVNYENPAAALKDLWDKRAAGEGDKITKVESFEDYKKAAQKYMGLPEKQEEYKVGFEKEDSAFYKGIKGDMTKAFFESGVTPYSAKVLAEKLTAAGDALLSTNDKLQIDELNKRVEDYRKTFKTEVDYKDTHNRAVLAYNALVKDDATRELLGKKNFTQEPAVIQLFARIQELMKGDGKVIVDNSSLDNPEGNLQELKSKMGDLRRDIWDNRTKYTHRELEQKNQELKRLTLRRHELLEALK